MPNILNKQNSGLALDSTVSKDSTLKAINNIIILNGNNTRKIRKVTTTNR